MIFKRVYKIIINYKDEIYHNLYLSLSYFNEIVLIFLFYLAKPIYTSTSTVHKLIESMIVLFATLTESTIPASNISTVFYCFRSYPSHIYPANGFFYEGMYCMSFLLGCFKAYANIFMPYSPSPE